MGVNTKSPMISIDGKSYFIYKDPPHLIKSARNYLEKQPVYVPNCHGIAKWEHIRTLYEYDCKSSTRMTPRLTDQYVSELRFTTKMKVKLATQILSHSVSAGLNQLVADKIPDSTAASTSSYVQKMTFLLFLIHEMQKIR